MTLRREFELPAEDVAFLKSCGRPWETITDGSQWLLIREFGTQNPGYAVAAVTVAIRIETGYPLAALDMVYAYPAIHRTDGLPIGATESLQTIDGRTYQRWSRHYTEAFPWRTGVDGIERHVHSIEEWFRREFDKCG